MFDQCHSSLLLPTKVKKQMWAFPKIITLETQMFQLFYGSGLEID
jgi:hypothetical protein